ncbi:MAG: hypothetical protein IJR66_05395 [Clostridia bacterium]|nr:hypothetical protein [Clostridia bacterium]
MIKILDVDKLFDEYISGYVYANIGKIKPEEIEDKMPILYNEFGDKPQKELDGLTPNTYYRSFSAKELLSCLKTHIEKNVPVSDFLCEALSDGDSEKEILNELNGENDEQYTLYLMNILNDKNSSIAIKRYLEFILWDYPESIRELATELLYNYADLIKEDILSNFNDTDKEKKDCLIDILSHCSDDDRVFEILLNAFIENQDNIPLYAGYLGKYGDGRALPFLKTAIENEKINYAEFTELRFAIEALGGECDVKRDFSQDKIYKKIKGLNNKTSN